MFFCKKTCKRIAFSESEHNNLVLSPSRMKSCASLYQKSHIQAYICNKKVWSKKKKKKSPSVTCTTHTPQNEWPTETPPLDRLSDGRLPPLQSKPGCLHSVTSKEAEAATFRHSTMYFINYKTFFLNKITNILNLSSLPILSKINRANFYRSTQLCTWRNNEE